MTSPTINLWFSAKDYINYLEHFELFNQAEVIEDSYESKVKGYPVGYIKTDFGEIYLNFMHYQNFDEARTAWERRKKRINFKNLFIIFVERDGCTFDLLERFDKLPFNNKIALVHKQYPTIKSSFTLNNCSQNGQIADFWTEKDRSLKLSYRKYYHQFNWRIWLNQK